MLLPRSSGRINIQANYMPAPNRLSTLKCLHFPLLRQRAFRKKLQSPNLSRPFRHPVKERILSVSPLRPSALFSAPLRSRFCPSLAFGLLLPACLLASSCDSTRAPSLTSRQPLHTPAPASSPALTHKKTASPAAAGRGARRCATPAPSFPSPN